MNRHFKAFNPAAMFENGTYVKHINYHKVGKVVEVFKEGNFYREYSVLWLTWDGIPEVKGIEEESCLYEVEEEKYLQAMPKVIKLLYHE
jgi:hypothetical protein